MFCATCGSEVDGMRCAVCGTELPPISVDGTSSAPRLSGWWRRVGATLVDELILVIPTYAVLIFASLFAGLIVGALAGIALGGFYQVKLLTNPAGQTIGNRMVSSYVRDATTGQVLTTGQALKRWGFVAAYSLFGLTGAHAGTVMVGVIGLADCVYPLFNGRKQTLHDIFAKTIVLIK